METNRSSTRVTFAVALFGASFLLLAGFAQQRGVLPRSAEQTTADAALQQTAAIASETNDASVAGLTVRLGTNEPISGGSDVDAQGQPPPLEIVIGTDGGTLDGFVVNDKKERMANTVVALVPDFPILRARPELYRSAVTGANGEFQLPAVPPGDYKLFAWEYAETGIWQEEEFLQPYEALGKRVQLGGSSVKDIEVTVISRSR